MIARRSRGFVRPSVPDDDRGGYALLSILWICTGILVLASGVSVAGREGVAASRNRIGIVRAEWTAVGCLERARAIVAEALAHGGERSPAGPLDAWNRVDAEVRTLASTGCALDARAVGSRLDVNAIGLQEAVALLLSLGTPRALADSTAAALLDARDPDDVPLPSGAESSWYIDRGLPSPANRPFRTLEELRLVRGFDQLERFFAHVSLDPGPVSINHASEAVLATLPGFTPSAAAAVAAARSRGRRLVGLSDLETLLSPDDRPILAAGLPQLVAHATFEPEAWILRASGSVDPTPVVVMAETRLVRRAGRVVVDGRRIWLP